MVFLNDHHLFCILDLKFFLCPRKPNVTKCTPLCILQTRQACVASHYVTLAGAESCMNTSFLGLNRREEAKNQWGACLLVDRTPPESVGKGSRQQCALQVEHLYARLRSWPV